MSYVHSKSEAGKLSYRQSTFLHQFAFMPAAKRITSYLHELENRASTTTSPYEQSPEQSVLSPLRSVNSVVLARNRSVEQNVEMSPTAAGNRLSNAQRSAPMLTELRRATNDGGSARQSGSSISIEATQFAIGDEYSMRAMLNTVHGFVLTKNLQGGLAIVHRGLSAVEYGIYCIILPAVSCMMRFPFGMGRMEFPGHKTS